MNGETVALAAAGEAREFRLRRELDGSKPVSPLSCTLPDGPGYENAMRAQRCGKLVRGLLR